MNNCAGTLYFYNSPVSRAPSNNQVNDAVAIGVPDFVAPNDVDSDPMNNCAGTLYFYNSPHYPKKLLVDEPELGADVSLL